MIAAHVPRMAEPQIFITTAPSTMSRRSVCALPDHQFSTRTPDRRLRQDASCSQTRRRPRVPCWHHGNVGELYAILELLIRSPRCHHRQAPAVAVFAPRAPSRRHRIARPEGAHREGNFTAMRHVVPWLASRGVSIAERFPTRSVRLHRDGEAFRGRAKLLRGHDDGVVTCCRGDEPERPPAGVNVYRY